MGKITLLVKTCLIILLNFVCSNSLLASDKSELESFSSTSKSICYMFFESKEIPTLDLESSIIETLTSSPYKIAEVSTSKMYAKPSVSLGTNPTVTVCQGIRNSNLPYTNATNSANKFTITYGANAKAQGFNDVAKSDFSGSTSGNFPILIPVNPAPGSYTANLKVHNTNSTDADGDNIPFTIVIKANATIDSPTNKSQEVCVNTAISNISFIIGGSGSGATLTGTLPSGVTGTYSGGVYKITGTPTNTGTFNYSVTTTGDCSQQSNSGVITIKPNPTFNKPSDISVCNNSQTTAVNFTGSSVANTTYSWTNNNTNIGLGASGNSNISAFTAKNSTNDPIIATITVTPTANGCIGTSQTFKITVNPTATLTKPIDITVCNNANISAINFTGGAVSNTSYSWINDNTSIGLGASGNGNISAFTAKNSTSASIVANLTVTPTANGCIGTPQTFKITVYPTANFTKPVDVVACNTEQIAAISFTGSNITGAATTYSWTNDKPNIGLASSGNGNIASFSASNSTNAPLTANITVTPTANGCAGTPQTFQLTVNPTTGFTKPTDIIACNSELIPATSFNGSTVTGTTYSWTNSNPSIGIGASGTGNISAFTGINTSNAPITAVITVIPKANNCNGTSQQFEITVNPTPTVTKPNNLIFCNSDVSSEFIFDGSQVTGTTYNWTNTNTAIGLAASGTGNLPSFSATNNGTAQIIAEITVTPVANNCAGAPQTFTIKVNPSIKVELALTPVSCNGEKNGAINITNASGGNGTLQFSIDNINFDTKTTLGNLYAGVYTLYVKDAEVCTYQIEVEITEPEELSITEATSTAETCFSGINGVHDGTITAGTISGGNEDYEYSIDNSSFQSSPNFTGLAAGNYTVFIKDNKGCATQSNISVGSLSEMKATLTKTDIKCFGDASGIVNVNNVSGGSGNYQYQIINNSNITGSEAWINTPTFTGLINGNYSINIRDVNYPSCIVSINDSYTLTQPTAALTTTTTATRTLNFGSPTGTATATPAGGSGGYTYEWRVSGQINVIQTTKTANSLAAGIYELTVYDSNGCSVVQNVTVTDIVKVEISETSRCLQNTDNIRTSSFQVDPDLTVGGIGDPYKFTYKWDFGASANPATAQGLDRYVVKYSSKGDKVITLTVTDEDGVVSVQKFDHYVGGCFEGCVGQNQSQDFQIDKNNYFIGDKFGTPLTESNCAATAEKYLWIDILKSSNVYVLDVELIYSTKKPSTTVLGSILQGNTDSGQLTGCFGKKITNSNNGKYEWELIPVGLYPLFKVDSPESNVNIEWECGEEFTLDQIRIRWTTNSGKECGDATGNSCLDSKSIVPVLVPLFANADVVDTPCNGTSLGSMTINAYGGVKPYYFSITGDVTANYVTTKEFYNLAVGSYTSVYVRDSKGTTYYFDPASKPIVVNQPDALALTVSEDAPIVCFGDLTSATANASGGTAPYTYLWNDDDAQVTKTAIELTAGSYTVTVTDANDCQTISTVVIEEPLELTVPAAGDDQLFKCGVITTFLEGNTPEEGQGKWIIKSGTGGSFPDNDLTDPSASFKGAANTSYILEWTISNPDGTCFKSDEIIISFSDDCSALDFDGIDDHVNFGNNHNFSTGNFTLEAWVKLKSIEGVRTVLSKRDASNLGSGGYDLVINNGAPTFRWGNISVSTSTKLTTSRWYHIAVTYNSDKYVLYVDGLDVGTKTGVRPVSIDSPFILGAMYNSSTPEIPSNYFNGWIEELRIWNKALSENQMHFLMNQRLEIGISPVKGTILPMVVTDNLLWSELKAYYQLLSADVNGGITLDETSNQINGTLKNIETNQNNTAPLPYISETEISGNWKDKNTWDKNAGAAEDKFWSWPNDNGINGEAIKWNIVITKSDSINSGGHDINVLGLISESGKLKMLNPNDNEDETNSGQGLFVSQYLKLNGEIKLFGDSQLVQPEGSIIDEYSTGFIEKDQQGTASSYNYNYWSSPVVPLENELNSTYTVATVLMDGTNTTNPVDINFGNGVTYADGALGKPRKISNRWIYKFRGKADEYDDFEFVGSTGELSVGEGYTMKGTSGNSAITDKQNYVFKGKPNNGTINLSVNKDQNYLLGNPYPSAIDANKFILDNLNASGGTNSKNIFNGALYFWDHFGGGSHQLAEYVGGYATYNLIGGVKAIATDDRINSNTGEVTSDNNVPGQYIPVGQGFFVNTVLDNDLSGNITIEGGDILFKNSQRAFVREEVKVSRFLSQEKTSNTQKEAIPDPKIRLDFSSPLGYHRQILVGANANATNGFDLGYDAPLNDYNEEDFFWLINNYEYVIQGVGHFDPEQILPIGIYISKKGEFKIEINKLENVPEETTIYLKDIEKDEYFDLRASEFKMEIEPGAYYERFQIVFNKPEDESSNPETSPEDPTDDEDASNDESSEETNEETEETDSEETEDAGTGVIETPEVISNSAIDIRFMSDNSELAIYNPSLMPIQKVEIYNLLGQRVQKYIEISNEKEIRLPVYEYASGIYVVRLFSENSRVSKNIIMKK